MELCKKDADLKKVIQKQNSENRSERVIRVKLFVLLLETFQ